MAFSDPTTIFRGNTLVSKMMDEGMRLAGLHYLHSTLRPAMEQVFSERKPCEIDPTRVKDANTIQANLANLKVCSSFTVFPIPLVFHFLKESRD